MPIRSTPRSTHASDTESTASPATRLLDLAVAAPGERSGIQGISDGPVNAGAVTLMKGKSGAMGTGWLEIDQTYIGPFH